jgi:predicted nucleic acid-binding protein
LINSYQVLVDSSVWIQYFRFGGIEKLDRLLEEDLVCTNDLILSELGPSLIVQNKVEIWESLRALNRIPLRIDWDLIRGYQILNMKNGINKIGIPNLIIVQQVIEEKLSIFTFDKHFKLMNNFLK